MSYPLHNNFAVQQRLLILSNTNTNDLLVIHRDIQPCNIIVSEGLLDNELWWSDELDIDGELTKMAKKCHITIIDFGFARALSPDDIKDDVGLKKAQDESLMKDATNPAEQRDVWKSYGDNIIDQKLEDTSHAGSRGRRLTLGDSFSRTFVRELSKFDSASPSVHSPASPKMIQCLSISALFVCRRTGHP